MSNSVHNLIMAEFDGLDEAEKREFASMFIDAANAIDSFKKTNKLKYLRCKEPGCDYKTPITEHRNHHNTMRGHNCKVADAGKAGAYAWILADEEAADIQELLYVGFGGNLEQSLRYLSLPQRYAQDTAGYRRVINEVFDEKPARLLLLIFEQDKLHDAEMWGDVNASKNFNKNGISHHAEGTLIASCKAGLANIRTDRLLNLHTGWINPKWTAEYDLAYYLTAIKEKIKKRDYLAFTRPEFIDLTNQSYLKKLLTKPSFKNPPNSFTQLTKHLTDVNAAHETKFTMLDLLPKHQ